MVIIAPQIQRERQPSFGELLGRNFGAGASEGLAQVLQRSLKNKEISRENEALKRFGLDVEGIQDPDIRKLAFAESIKGRNESVQNSPLDSAKTAIDNLKKLVGKSGIGLSGVINPLSSARRNRGEFEATQAALLPIFKAAFPRGFTEKEFKVIQQKYLPQSHDTEETIKGKIKGLENLLSSVSGGSQLNKEDFIEEIKEEKPSKKLSKVPSGSLLTVSAINKIISIVGNDKNKVKATAKKMGYEID